MEIKKILITGTAGFIGFHMARRLLKQGYGVVGIDNINSYYDPEIKYERLQLCGIGRTAEQFHEEVTSDLFPEYRFIRMHLEDRDALQELFRREKFNIVCHLAAQAGVRYSLENPQAYIDSNITGFLNVLECCRQHKVDHLVYASSSSVYGLNGAMPLSTHHSIAHPVSMYAATKKSNELMAHTYSHLFGVPTTGLRFFTVYGPWGRPDMALYLFTKAILQKEPLKIFNHGDMLRDFTYIDDIVEGIQYVLFSPPPGDPAWDECHPDPASSRAPYKVYNLGNSNPVKLLDFVHAIEEKLRMDAMKEFLDMQPGDVQRTFSDVSDLKNDFGYQPTTSVRDGIAHFVDWYLDYHKINLKSL